MAKALAAALMVVVLAGCTAEPGPDACGAPGLQDLVGRNDDVLAAMTLPAGTRLIYPGAPVTEDFRPERLNIDIDQSGTITGVWCG